MAYEWTENQLNDLAEIYADKERKGLSKEAICERFQVDASVIDRQLMTENIQVRIRRNLDLWARKEAPAIYQALFKKAKEGNISAIELYLARFEGFKKQEPTAVQVNINPEREQRERKQAVVDYLKSIGKYQDIVTVLDTQESNGKASNSNEQGEGATPIPQE